MNKKKTTVKGFTLIELIIVLAIFSVIMTLVMSFIDPVSKIMTKTSVRERTAAYVDNIGEYVSKSIRHAQNIVVYEHGLTGDEKDLVTDFVDTYYNGAVSNIGGKINPLNGKVHVLKLINTDEGSLKAGRIYESVYDFNAGNGRPTTVYFDKNTSDYVEDSVITANLNSFRAAHTAEDDEKKSWSDEKILTNEYGYTPLTKIIFEGENKHSVPTLISENVSVINDEHFKEYSYYYQLGMYTFDPDHDVYSHMTKDEQKDYDKVKDKYFYSRLNRMTNSSGTIMNDGVDQYQFVMNIVSFMPEKKDKLESRKNYTYKDDSDNDVAVSSFRSPAAMNSVGMTLKNVQMQEESNSIKYYRKKLTLAKNDKGETIKDANGFDLYVPEKDENGNEIIEAVTNNLGANPFVRVTGGTSDNIYMIFTVPTEIMDTEWKDLTPSEPTTVPNPEKPFKPVA